MQVKSSCETVCLIQFIYTMFSVLQTCRVSKPARCRAVKPRARPQRSAPSVQHPMCLPCLIRPRSKSSKRPSTWLTKIEMGLLTRRIWLTCLHHLVSLLISARQGNEIWPFCGIINQIKVEICFVRAQVKQGGRGNGMDTWTEVEVSLSSLMLRAECLESLKSLAQTEYCLTESSSS